MINSKITIVKTFKDSIQVRLLQIQNLRNQVETIMSNLRSSQKSDLKSN